MNREAHAENLRKGKGGKPPAGEVCVNWQPLFPARQGLVKKATGQRLYAGAKGGRLMFTASSGSANNELYSSLPVLRNRSRALVRDVVYAKRAKGLIVDNVIGQGMGMQAQVTNRRGRLMKEINDPIEEAWAAVVPGGYRHTGGVLHFSDLERAAMGEVFRGGRGLHPHPPQPIRARHHSPGLELIEAERIADDYEVKVPGGARVTMGIEHDEYGRPLAYYVHTSTPTTCAWRRARGGRDPAHSGGGHDPPEGHGTLAPSTGACPGCTRHQPPEPAGRGLRKPPWWRPASAPARWAFENPEGYTDDLGDGEENGTPTATVAEAGEFAQLPPATSSTAGTPTTPTSLRPVHPGHPAWRCGRHSGHVLQRPVARLTARPTIPASVPASWTPVPPGWCSSSGGCATSASHCTAMAVCRHAEPFHPGLDLLAYARQTCARSRPPSSSHGAGAGWTHQKSTPSGEAEKAGYITKDQIIANTGGGQDIGGRGAGAASRELDLLDRTGISTDTTDFGCARVARSAQHQPLQNDRMTRRGRRQKTPASPACTPSRGITHERPETARPGP